ncbi:hypothetical protein HPULCUR_012194 [Helicostylum pulchrum]|uniref:Uncharacterized protein n=1 Tax=Helicostylum pulchrum TaxID=562976 RepID=A0ABP9YIG9_9FUNG
METQTNMPMNFIQLINTLIQNKEPSAPLLEDIKEDPPVYDQKPDECGLTVINHIQNKSILNIDNNKINEISKHIESINVSTIGYYKDMLIKDGNIFLAETINITNIIEARNRRIFEIKYIKDNYSSMVPIFDSILLNSDNKVITDIEDYKNKLNKIDLQNLSIQYNGINLQRLYRSTIELQFKLLLSNNSTNNINSTLLKYINKIVMNIPK